MQPARLSCALGSLGLVRFGLALAMISGPAAAVTITTDYSSLGSVYQDATGKLFSTAAAGRVDVTTDFKADVSAGLSYLQNSILLPWNTTISFQLADLSSSGAVGDSQITSLDVNKRSATSLVRVDSGNLGVFIDKTPLDNSEFTMSSSTTALGGGDVNVARFGNAVAKGPAVGLWDLVTLVVHEAEHSLGFSGGSPRFIDLAGAVGTANRKITVPKALSGLPGDFSVPFVSGSSHIDGVVNGGVFNDTVVAEPGFGSGQRALPTAVELYALCVVNGCSAPADINVNAIPEPQQWLLMACGGAFLWAVLSRRQRRMQA